MSTTDLRALWAAAQKTGRPAYKGRTFDVGVNAGVFDGIRVHPDGRVEKSNPDSNLPGYHNWELLETLEVDK